MIAAAVQLSEIVTLVPSIVTLLSVRLPLSTFIKFPDGLILLSLPPPVNVTLPLIVIAAVIPTSPFIVTVPPDIVTPPTVSPSFHVVSAEIVSVIASACTKTVLAGNTENIIANASMIDNNFLDFMIFPPKIILFPQKYLLKNLLYLCICSYLNYTPYTNVRCNNF